MCECNYKLSVKHFLWLFFFGGRIEKVLSAREGGRGFESVWCVFLARVLIESAVLFWSVLFFSVCRTCVVCFEKGRGGGLRAWCGIVACVASLELFFLFVSVVLLSIAPASAYLPCGLVQLSRREDEREAEKIR